MRGRRRALISLAAGALYVVVRPARATPEELAAALHAMFGERPITPGKVQIDLPMLAENGAIVPVTVSVASPMTEHDHVRSIHLFAEKNPQPRVLDLYLGPQSGKARVATRIRIGESQNVLAVAVMNDGSLWSAAKQVEVTVGGCGN